MRDVEEAHAPALADAMHQLPLILRSGPQDRVSKDAERNCSKPDGL
jgi:hypothetical protein